LGNFETSFSSDSAFAIIFCLSRLFTPWFATFAFLVSSSDSLLLSLLVSSFSLVSGESGSPSQTSISTERHPRRRT
jgi:hypothetical protein